jgi:hypothetical protein
MGKYTLIVWISLFVIVMSYMINFENQNSEMIYLKCSNNKEYRVKNIVDKEKAVELIGSIHDKLIKTCDVLMTKYPDDERVIRLNEKFKNTILCETNDTDNTTSYSINKGEKIVLCIRNKKTHELVDENVLLFVSLHELSHIMTLSVGHTEEFWNNFKFVLENAQSEKIYKCIDYLKNPQEYCGITVNNTPLVCSV